MALRGVGIARLLEPDRRAAVAGRAPRRLLEPFVRGSRAETIYAVCCRPAAAGKVASCVDRLAGWFAAG
jgi:hypothetical protein